MAMNTAADFVNALLYAISGYGEVFRALLICALGAFKVNLRSSRIQCSAKLRSIRSYRGNTAMIALILGNTASIR